MEELIRIGSRIKKWREERDMSRNELSFLSSIHYTHLMNIENGKSNPQINTLIKILDILEKNLKELFADEP